MYSKQHIKNIEKYIEWNKVKSAGFHGNRG